MVLGERANDFECGKRFPTFRQDLQERQIGFGAVSVVVKEGLVGGCPPYGIQGGQGVQVGKVGFFQKDFVEDDARSACGGTIVDFFKVVRLQGGQGRQVVVVGPTGGLSVGDGFKLYFLKVPQTTIFSHGTIGNSTRKSCKIKIKIVNTFF